MIPHLAPGHRPRPRRRTDRGAAPVELAILLPLLLALLLGAPQVCALYNARTVALAAAQQAVATERLHDTQPGTGRIRAEQFLSRAEGWLTDWQVTDPVRDRQAGTVSVTVRGQALSILPWVTWQVDQTAHGTIEQFTQIPAPGGGGVP